MNELIPNLPSKPPRKEVVDSTPGELTPYLRLDEVLVHYSQTLHDVLKDNFVGVYLLGSLAIGDFDLTSDVDFMVVTVNDLGDDEVARVQSSHIELLARDTRWVKHLEYSFFPMSKLRELSSPYDANGARNASGPRELWKFNNGQASIVRTGHDNTLVTRWTLRNMSPAVLGPTPSTFAPEVSPNGLRREIQTSMLGWEQRAINDASEFDNRFHQVFMVLNNCRALQDLHEGKITSKREGVVWAKQHLDPMWFRLIDFCWQERQDTAIDVSQPADPDAFRQTLAFIEYTTRLAEKYRV
jgi:predicted nucleotidyltransferase